MIYYDFLVLVDKMGFWKGMSQCCLSNQHAKYKEIYEYHLSHPKLSHREMSLIFKCSKKYIYNAYLSMNQNFMTS